MRPFNKNNRVGAWRSLVAHLHGVQGVPSSNLGAPTSLSEHHQKQLWTPLWTPWRSFAEAEEPQYPDFALVAARSPGAAVCLISALAFHAITTQIPAVVHLAVPRGRYHQLKLDPLPVQVYRFDAKTFEAGLETHDLGGI